MRTANGWSALVVAVAVAVGGAACGEAYVEELGCMPGDSRELACGTDALVDPGAPAGDGRGDDPGTELGDEPGGGPAADENLGDVTGGGGEGGPGSQTTGGGGEGGPGTQTTGGGGEGGPGTQTTGGGGDGGDDGGDCELCCSPGSYEPCPTSCGPPGVRHCGPDGRWNACVPPDETCGNGVDDDCDGVVDDGCPECNPGETRSCTTSCGSSASRSCDASGHFSACNPGPERCDNGADDDCDGHVDARDLDCPGPSYDCEDFGVGHCNGDMGYGDRCAAQDNERGCTPEAFFAWCNRRNVAYPGMWDDFVVQWVVDRCEGPVLMVGPTQATATCTTPDNETYTCTTPLVVSFDPEAAVTFKTGGGSFALDPTRPGESDWPTAATPWLALDRDGSGAIEDGSELFGSATPVPGGGRALSGFEALAALDENGDGCVDRADPAWDRLLLWADRDSDRRSAPAELRPVEDARLVRIELAYELHERCDDRGNCERERALMLWRDPAGKLRVGAVIDAWPRVRQPRPGLMALR